MSRFDQQYLYEYETVTDPAAAAAGEGASGDGGEGGWSGPSQEEWQQLQETNAELRQFVEQSQTQAERWQQFQQGQGQQQDDWTDIRDGLNLIGVDPKRFDAYVKSQHVDPALAPFQETQQVVTNQQMAELVADVSADVKARTGDFDAEIAELFAQRLLEGEITKAGGNLVRGLEVTMEKAAQMARDYEKKIREQAIAQHTNQLQTLAGVPGEPGSSYSQGVQQRTVPDFRKAGVSVTERMFGGGDTA